MKLLNTVKQLVLEGVSVQTLTDAIRKKQVVVIYYDGDEPGGRGLREIWPVCLGYSKANNQVLRAWDLEGASHRGYLGKKPLPGWRLFRVDKIQSFKPTGENFTTLPSDYNINGDKSMTRVIINATQQNEPGVTEA